MGSGCSSVNSHASFNVDAPLNSKTRSVSALKIAIVGDAEVGKTSILLRYIRNQFSPLYIPTKKPLIENVVKKLNLPSHSLTSVTFWDIPGREDINLYRTYFKNLDAAIVVVDLTDPDSISMGMVWKQIVLNNMFYTGHGAETGDTDPGSRKIHVTTETFPVILLGTKYDIIESKFKEEGKHFFPAVQHGKVQLLKSEKSSEELQNRPVEEKPECIHHMENMAKEHNFVGSVVVSARDGDGGVHSAIQSFVRHILEKHHMPRRWQTPEKKKVVTVEEKNVGKLEKTQIKEVDDAFNEPELLRLIRREEVLCTLNKKSQRKFQDLCLQGELVEKEGNSLEDCIVGLRNFLKDSKFKIQLVEDSVFCKLQIKSDEEDRKISKSLKKIIKAFNKDYATSCRAILEEFPMVDIQLLKIDNNVASVVSSYEDSAVRTASDIADLKKKSSMIEKNRALIKHMRDQAQSYVKNVDNALKRIKTAFIW
ncbi:uncharacterized protein LOC121370796 [Gigantopelta aegis]|uniref:uncharacterized protein LOC121370796 n=1 Tax=Gigantopelta aegis TaxID=1735272 RepID=UPI001B889560|nr:uncharacterized protein LOC121370796 [Gigantopelta aegis]